MKISSRRQSASPQPLRKCWSLLVVSSLLAGLACAQHASAQGATPSNDPLLFPKDKFTLKTMSVTLPSGKKHVVYRSYQHLLYVTKPVDKNYESLDVKVPVSVNGVPVDATNAPILFDVNIGGYMSSANIKVAGSNPAGPPGAGPGGPPGGPGGGPPGGFPGGPGGPPGAGPGNTDGAGLASGYVIVSPGARGRDNKFPNGIYYGKAPAAIVDLKAAVRYIRHNAGALPGNDNWIISSGCSAGGALSALLGASGNSPLYEPYEKAIGAAEEPDNIFAAGCGSPVTDLDHNDMSYEWAFGASKPQPGVTVDPAVSAQLKAMFPAYEASLNLQGQNGFGQLTADNLGEYLVKYYLAPQADKYLLNLSGDKRKQYLANNPWLHWDGKNANFTYAEFAAQHIVRHKTAPAFSDFNLRAPETNEFGDATTNAQVFTNYSLQHLTGNPNATIDPKLQAVVNLMNPMYFITRHNDGVAVHWWLHHGAIETDSAPVSTINMATGLQNMGRDVHAVIFWDAGHCEDLDPQGFITWIGKITGYTIKS